MLFISSLFFFVLSTVSSTVINTTELTCPPGWFGYRDSCYFFDNPLLEHDKAEIKCWEMGSTLLVVETLDEYELITDRAKESAWSWVGLTQSDDLEHHIPQWSTSGGVDPILINWLVKPYLAVSNGWTTQAKCAAHLNVPAGPSASCTFFLPCTVQTYSICEKNATLFPRMWEHGLIGISIPDFSRLNSRHVLP
ncbi:hypothetical protein RB195_020866 [Necator americanus]|uniref:C-type lectin domain-containing protein n=1 Tax=Necator americanus TaxID=51031 RepID=A0ABR1CPC1_NECAM